MVQKFQHLRRARHSVCLSLIALALALAAPVLMPAYAQTAPPQTLFPKEPQAMSWKTECIGRVLIDMPTDRPRSWSAQIDAATVRRLQSPLSAAQFWAGVETVRDQYARQKHDEHSSRLGHYERMDARKVAIVIGYDSRSPTHGCKRFLSAAMCACKKASPPSKACTRLWRICTTIARAASRWLLVLTASRSR